MTAKGNAALTGAVIAHNEELMLPGCLERLSFCDEILVLDSNSSDTTAECARRAGARVEARAFDDYASQRNAAMELASGQWVFFVDADERVPGDLAREVRRVVDTWRPGEPDLYEVPRRAWALGAEMPGVTGQPDLQRRLLRRAAVRYDESRRVHEVPVGGVAGRLRTPLWHLTHRSIGDVLEKLDRYSAMEAAQLVAAGAALPSPRSMLADFLRDLGGRLRRGGMRHGHAGLIESMLLAHYRFLVRARQWEMQRRPPLADVYRALESEVPR
jgi:glycosyltransferase involved in cell wall biosynthesis